MDIATCNIIYVDRNVRAESQLTASSAPADIDVALGESIELRASVQLLLEAFGNGMFFKKYISKKAPKTDDSC